MTQQQLYKYDDFDLQMSLDSNNKARIQIVGMRNGSKDILKEFDHINFMQNPERVFAAPEKNKKEGSFVKVTVAFAMGLLIGGIVVYVVMKNKQKEILSMSAPVQPQEIIHMKPENDVAMWAAEYDRDIFTRGE